MLLLIFGPVLNFFTLPSRRRILLTYFGLIFSSIPISLGLCVGFVLLARRISVESLVGLTLLFSPM